jgi:RIO kinase 1
MDTLSEYYNELDDEGQFEEVHHKQTNKPKVDPQTVQQFIQRQDEARQTIAFTYKPARFEEGWLLDSLGPFFEQRWITDILSKIKGGKEASVYLCRSGEQVRSPLVAAKVFRPRMLRNLKNDQLYRQDRAVLDGEGKRIVDLGMLKAQKKRSVYGEQIRHQSWLAFEFQTLKTLHAAGADVPQPYEMGENAIVMSYIGDKVTAAPTLNTVRLDPGEVRPLYERLLRDVRIMLAHGIVHGDLSAYNVLYWKGKITLIDFPQVVSPSGHRSAYKIFSRDITRICDYFAGQGLQTDPRRLAADLWRSSGYRFRPEVEPDWQDGNIPEGKR